MYFPAMSAETGALDALHMVPMKIAAFRLTRASSADAAWMRNVLSTVSAAFDTTVEIDDNGVLTARA
jgi:hypothetical protein